MFPRRAWIPNAITAAAIVCGFAAMLETAAGRFEVAVYFVFAAILLDMLDGRVARLLRATSHFGQQLDSLADMVSFGAAPALLASRTMLPDLGALGAAVAAVYLLAGAYRLARYNVQSDAHAKAVRTTGLPIPIAAAFVIVAVLLRAEMDAAWGAVVVLSMSGFMISRLPFPTVRGADLVSLLLLANIVNFAAILAWPSLTTAGWWFAWMLAAALLAPRRDRRLAARQPNAAVPQHELPGQ